MLKRINFSEHEKSNVSSSTLALDPDNKKILFAIEDERILRRKNNLFCSDVRSWMNSKLSSLGIDNAEVIDINGITNKYSNNDNEHGALVGHRISRERNDHHELHALSALCQSGFNDATILVLDGCDRPEGSSIVLFSYEDGKLIEVKRYSSEYSLGVFYGLGCLLSGFKWTDSGKLMGLSTYGTVNEDRYVPFLLINKETGEIETINGRLLQNKYINDAPSIDVDFNEQLLSCINYHGGNGLEFQSFSFKNRNLASYFQRAFEDAVFSILEYALNNLPSRNLILSGGCALNCTCNGKILRSKKWKNLFIPNTCDDAGNSFGIAVKDYGIKINSPFIYNKITYPVPSEYSRRVSLEYISNLIRSGKIIAWFEGGSEYGPRALCHRSLLGNPFDHGIPYRLNEIKNRDYWRPLAPVVLDRYFHEYFNVEKIFPVHRTMLSTEYLKRKYVGVIPSAPDGTSRPQVLFNNRYNSTLYSLMKDYNLPILINTSMNGRNEPICETPDDAIKFTSRYDDVILVFIRNNQPYIK